MGSSGPGRVRVERGIYRQPNGKYAVCWRHAGRLRFRTVGFDLADARRARLALIAATRDGKVPVSPRLRFETVAGQWLERFEAKVAAGERHPRTLDAHRYQLDRHLLPALGRRTIAFITVGDVAELLHELRRTGRSAKTSAPRCSSSDSRRKRNHGRARTLAQHPPARSTPRPIEMAALPDKGGAGQYRHRTPGPRPSRASRGPNRSASFHGRATLRGVRSAGCRGRLCREPSGARECRVASKRAATRRA
jgi:hypothetical protein